MFDISAKSSDEQSVLEPLTINVTICGTSSTVCHGQKINKFLREKQI